MQCYRPPLLLLCVGSIVVLAGCSQETAQKSPTVAASNMRDYAGRGMPRGGGSVIQIGKPAPEIAGTDAQGQAFKLSDYRGKVVVLDFWGDW